VDPERRKEVDKAEAAGYLPQLRALVKSATVPLWWWWRNSIQVGSSILHNETLCAVDTGEKTICVTADHVYAQYLEHIERQDVECQMGNVRVRLEEFVVDRDAAVDIATFAISPILVAGSGIRVHAAHTWPPANLAEKEIVVLGSYPRFRRRERTGAVDSSLATFFAPVAQSSESHNAFRLNLGDSYWPDGSGGVPQRSELGGMSGGPIFRCHSEPVEFLELAGFFYEASAEFELIRDRHASCQCRWRDRRRLLDSRGARCVMVQE
jgi:hypothetical protein